MWAEEAGDVMGEKDDGMDIRGDVRHVPMRAAMPRTPACRRCTASLSLFLLSSSSSFTPLRMSYNVTHTRERESAWVQVGGLALIRLVTEAGLNRENGER